MTLTAITYSRGSLSILNQLLLPHQTVYDPLHSARDAWHAIHEMRVRGAPAIAIVAALSLAVELDALVAKNQLSAEPKEVEVFIREKLEYLVSSRPTAVNLAEAAGRLGAIVSGKAEVRGVDGREVAEAYIAAAQRMLEDDIKDNRAIGEFGARWVLENAVATGSESGSEKGNVAVLTHCNTGSLATAGYGTALGVIRSLHATGSLERVYCTETRPYNQGSRLTAYELVHDKIPATLITDNMAAALLARKSAGSAARGSVISAIIVGADRVAANGDTANKIGTYGLAVLAKYHSVKFLVAAPRTTIDMNTKTGADIVIEERPKQEVTRLRGPRVGEEVDGLGAMETITIAANGIDVWNPAFDVTPAALIDGIITEVGVVEKDGSGAFHLARVFE